LGSCPTDATREGRCRRAARKFAAMPTPERLREQSSRLSGPVVTYNASVPDIHNAHSQTRVAVKVHRAAALNANCNDAVPQTAVQFALPLPNRNRKWIFPNTAPQLDECVANAERTDNPQHKNTWLRLAECYRVLIERAKQEDKEQALVFCGFRTPPTADVWIFRNVDHQH